MDAVIETERLTLRPHAERDLPDSCALWGDARVTRYVGGRPLDPEEVWHRLLRHVGHWALRGYGCFVVRERGTGRFVGEVGLADSRRHMEPPLPGAPEMGWVLSPQAQGNGFATEAVQAVLAWAEGRLPGERTFCLVHPENAASLRVAGKCGYRPCGRGAYGGEPTLILERLRPGHR